MLIQQSASGIVRTFLLTKVEDHINGYSGGAAVQVRLSKAGGSFGAGGGAAPQLLESGIYKYVYTTTDINTLGSVTLSLRASGADPTDVIDEVVGFNPYTAWQSRADIENRLNEYGAVRPTVSGRLLAINATNQTGIDWANIGSPNTEVSLGGTTVRGSGMIITNVTTLDARLPAALVGGRMDSDASAISGAAATADRLEAWMNGFITGSAVGTPTSTVIDTDLTETTDNHYNHMILAFTGGALIGQARRISAYNGTTKEITVQPAFTEAPVATDTFIIVTIIVGGLDATGRVDVGSVAGTAQTAGDIMGTLGVAGAGLTNINLPNQTMDIVGNITGNLSGSVGSVTGAVGSVTGNVGGNVVGSIGSVASSGILISSLQPEASNEIADRVLRRGLSNVEAVADSRSLAWGVAKLVNKVAISTNTLTVNRTDDATSLFSQAVSVSGGALPIIAVDTNP